MEHNYVHNLHIVTHFFPVPATELTFWTEVHKSAKPEILTLWLFIGKLDSARLRSPSFHLLGAGPTFPDTLLPACFWNKIRALLATTLEGMISYWNTLLGISSLLTCSSSDARPLLFPPRLFCVLLPEWPFQNVLISMLYFFLALPHLSNKGQTQSTAPCSLPT